MRALPAIAAILCVLLLAIPTVVIVRAATAPVFRWSGAEGECPVVQGQTVRCLSVQNVIALVAVAVGGALGLAGILMGRPILARAGAILLLAEAALVFAYRAITIAFSVDDLLASLPVLVVAVVLLLAARPLSRQAPAAVPS